MPINPLAVSGVASNSLGAIKVRVDPWVNLVEQVAVVGSSSRVGVSTANSSAVSTVSAMSSGQARASGASVSAVATSQARASGACVGTMAAGQARRSV